MLQFKDLGLNSKSWAFVEAKKVLEKIGYKVPQKGYVLFETGYGPSGLPHIGTFGEVARTSMVMFAFSQLSDIPMKLFAFSDDLDGLRKVPTNIPNQDLVLKDLGKPLTSVVDPFGKYNSFGEHNNAKLCEFLDTFGFTYEFKSSTKIYQAGHFNDALLQVLKHYDEILEVMLPSLGDERRETYSPFLPIDKKSGKVLQAKVVKTSLDNKSITYIDEEGNEVETSVLDGNVKLQWKVDWAMRWYALDVDYEMSGKDLIPSVVLSSKICKILGKNPPLNLTYELFLDKNGEKISKSKGNGLSIEEWLRYGNKESLTYFMYQKPQTAKRLYFDIIPKSVDDWLLSLAKFKDLSVEEKLESPIFFIYNNNPIEIDSDITFSLIVNLVSVVKSDDKNLLWSFIKKYKNIEGKSIEIIDDLLTYAINYYNDFIQPTLEYKTLNDLEKNYLQTLLNKLEVLSKNSNASEVQNVVYSCGKELNLELKDWFALLYESLLGQKQGPRMGTFFVLYGLDNSIKLIKHTLQK